MDKNITIVTCYKAGTESMLEVWRDAVVKHTKIAHKIVVVTAERDATDQAKRVFIGRTDVEVFQAAVVP